VTIYVWVQKLIGRSSGEDKSFGKGCSTPEAHCLRVAIPTQSERAQRLSIGPFLLLRTGDPP
jgi:hypothetical protein